MALVAKGNRSVKYLNVFFPILSSTGQFAAMRRNAVQ